MAGALLRIKSELQDCDQHLAACDGFGTEIESYLTQYLLVVLSADVQQALLSLCDDRAGLTGDEAISNYVSVTARKVLRSIKKDEIAAFAGHFGTQSKQRLNELVADSEVVAFNNAIVSRHEVAHNKGSRITFQELKNAVTAAEKIIEAFRICLSKSVD